MLSGSFCAGSIIAKDPRKHGTQNILTNRFVSFMHMPRPLVFLFWSIVFGVSYTQAPLYYSNHNQYFLHGLAEVPEFGDLNHDWLGEHQGPHTHFLRLGGRDGWLSPRVVVLFLLPVNLRPLF